MWTPTTRPWFCWAPSPHRDAPRGLRPRTFVPAEPRLPKPVPTPPDPDQEWLTRCGVSLCGWSPSRRALWKWKTTCFTKKNQNLRFGFGPGPGRQRRLWHRPPWLLLRYQRARWLVHLRPRPSIGPRAGAFAASGRDDSALASGLSPARLSRSVLPRPAATGAGGRGRTDGVTGESHTRVDRTP